MQQAGETATPPSRAAVDDLSGLTTIHSLALGARCVVEPNAVGNARNNFGNMFAIGTATASRKIIHGAKDTGICANGRMRMMSLPHPISEVQGRHAAGPTDSGTGDARGRERA